MLRPDILSIRQFYHSPLGGLAQTLLARAAHALWPTQKMDTMLVVGYHAEWLGAWQPMIKGYIMPASQGAVAWPSRLDNLAILAEETRLPLMDGQFNRVALAHVLEHTADPAQLIREVWRILLPSGRVMVIVPNRASQWSRTEATPFADGQPYSIRQLKHLLEEEGFVITRMTSALHLPPYEARWWLRLCERVEPWVAAILPTFGGVLIMEAEKQIYAGALQSPSRRLAKSKERGRLANPVPVRTTTTPCKGVDGA